MKIAGIGAPATAKKEWAWSYSKLKNYESCPKRHYEVDLQKNYSDTDGNEAIAYGNAAHVSLAAACNGTAPLASKFSHWQTWVDRVRAGPGDLLVEQKFAITRDFRPTTYFAKDCWYRGIGDVVRIDGPVGLVLDWKTGKIAEDSVQLMLMAQCLFSHYPQLKRVRSEFVWLKEECTTPEVFDKKELAEQWVSLLPRVKALEAAHIAQSYPPKPNSFCKNWCPVNSCTFHGKGAFGK